MEELTKELLELEYCHNNLSESAICKKYNINRYALNKLFSEYNIQKNASLNDNKAHDKLKDLTFEIFLDLYTNKNKSYKEIASLYNATERQVKRLNVEKYHCKRNILDKNNNIRTSLKNATQILDYKEINNKREKSVFSKYGVKNVFQLESIKQKIKQTNINKYGVSNVFQSPIIKEKIKNTLNEKYGINNPMELKVFTDKQKDTMRKTNLERYGLPWYCLSEKCMNSSNGAKHSSVNDKFAKMLDNNKIKYDREYRIDGKSFDFIIKYDND